MALVPNAVFACRSYEPAAEGRRESLFALGNGVLLVRSCPPWAEADGVNYPGTYQAGLYDPLDQMVAGEQLCFDALVNLPDGLSLTFRLPGEAAWFSLRDVEILDYCHALDAATGVARREVLFRDRQGRRSRVAEQRLASMDRPELAALRLDLRPEEWKGRVELRSAIRGKVANEKVARYAPYDHRHLEPLAAEAPEPGLLLLTARTLRSRIGIALAARTWLEGAEVQLRGAACDGDCVAEHAACLVAPDRPLRIEKLVAIASGRDAAAGDAAATALGALRAAPRFEALRTTHAAAWRALHQDVPIEAERRDLACTLRLNAFHLLQTISPNSVAFQAGMPARGWQEAYHGHVFWDETFVQPFLATRFPELARSLLLYRCARLEVAREAARRHGFAGAMFPWRSARTGREETPRRQPNPLSGRWMPDHTRLQRHIGAAIAYNIWQYVLATGDEGFLASHGTEAILEIARFFASAASFDPALGRWRIRGVVGPDEYHGAYPGADTPGIDDNAYTNVMAAWTLRLALQLPDRLPSAARHALCERLRLGAEEPALWDEVSRGLRLAFHADGRLEQFEAFGSLRPLDLQAIAEQHPGERVDWVLEACGETADAYQVVKQADTFMLPYLLPGAELDEVVHGMGYRLPPKALRRTADHDLARTTHDSSLSRVVWAGALARLDPAASWRLFHHEAVSDHDATSASAAADGLHLGAMAGVMDVLQRHYLGFRVQADAIMLDPAPPAELGRVRLGLRCRFGAFALDWSGSVLTLHSDPSNPAPTKVRLGGGLEVVPPGRSVAMRPGCGD